MKMPNIVMRTYAGMPEKTAEDFRNLKLHTGDLGRLDADGYLYFLDRVKDYIRRRGENVSSMEVESVVTAHAEMLEAAAVGVKAGEGASAEDEILICVVRARRLRARPGAAAGVVRRAHALLRRPALRARDGAPAEDPHRARAQGRAAGRGHRRGHVRPRRVSEPLDLGEAADYILSERPGLDEDAVWAVLNELGEPPAKGQDKLALELLSRSRPEVRPRDARRIIDEWRAYARLAEEPDWDD